MYWDSMFSVWLINTIILIKPHCIVKVAYRYPLIDLLFACIMVSLTLMAQNSRMVPCRANVC